MAIALGPIWIKLEQSLKGLGRFLVAAAIAEQPRAKVEYFRIAAGQAESPPTTLQRLLAVAAVEQRLGYAAVQLGIFVATPLALARIDETSIHCSGV